ncbi:MAG: DUF4743 domain-containing protein [Rhodospirillaceae bacterium]
MAYLDHIRACNAHDLSGFRDFRVAGSCVGRVRHAFAERLAEHRDLVSVGPQAVDLLPCFTETAARTAAVSELLDRLIAVGVIPPKRGELYPVLTAWGMPPLLLIDRGAVSYFGIAAFGLHVNGFVCHPDGLHLWIGVRARDRSVAPGKLDNLIAGGQPAGLSLEDNLIKEAAEEAGLDPETARRAKPAGAITYVMETPPGLKVDCLFVYDLELDPAVMPCNTDGEVESFELMPWRKVAGIVRDTMDFKFNCNLVIIDFLIRHGLITPDEPDYLELCQGRTRRI